MIILLWLYFESIEIDTEDSDVVTEDTDETSCWPALEDPVPPEGALNYELPSPIST